ncbi:MAG: high-potential iron-sulfur protein [Pseudomonadota bacterium]|nr:high-potential iron-sulfur protein [Pseudomonadota bacterium]
MTRRSLFRMTLAGAVVSVASVARASEQACLDGKMNEGLATALNFTEHSPKPESKCGNCGLFDGGAAACGHCQIFSCNVPSSGHCDSWSPKG